MMGGPEQIDRRLSILSSDHLSQEARDSPGTSRNLGEMRWDAGSHF